MGEIVIFLRFMSVVRATVYPSVSAYFNVVL